jgi:GNAT superfamily N-acetyltransferase
LTLVDHAGGLAGYNGVFALFREASKIVSLPPDRAKSLRPFILTLSPDFDPEDLANALQPFASAVIGPAFIGYAERVPEPRNIARLLTVSDAPAAMSLKASCSDSEWLHGGADISEHVASGVFLDGKLVALAGYEVWGGAIAHISVVVHPVQRGLGFGTAVVAHVSAQALAAGLLPQYRTLESNQSSIGIARRLGFIGYARSMAIRFSSDS